MKHLAISFLSLLIFSCGTIQSQQKTGQVDRPPGFNDYWYGGNAEITSYRLEQARYGEIHSGEAVLVFVTEPFSKSKQVKLDDWRDSSPDNVSVLKLNATKKFLTGIYPYSMMSSTFKPVSFNQYPEMLKVTTSSQEWCGHTFMQLNLGKNDYRLRGFSYFESEGDVDLKVPKTMLEDEVWSMIRLNPALLPVGEIEMLPSTFYLRLRHQEAEPQKVKSTLDEIGSSSYSDKSHFKYVLDYTNRNLTIYFEKEFPFGILGWEESYISGFGNPQKLTTKATKINTIKSAYWGKNSNTDREIREQLGLSTK